MIRCSLYTLAFPALLSLAACGGAPAASPAASAPAVPATPVAAGARKEPGDAKVGDPTKCAVSGEEIVVEATSPRSEHEGKTYYFCCGGCKKKFDADPAKYVKKT